MNTDNYYTDELEAKLLSRFGTKNHFAVPEGYFDKLPGRVVERIARRKQRRSLVWRWAAACVLAVGLWAGGMLCMNWQQSRTVQTEEEIQYIEDALDYSMIDNMSIASYLTEAE